MHEPHMSVVVICALQCFSAQATFSVLCHSFLSGSHPPPRSTPWGAYRPTISGGAVPLFIIWPFSAVVRSTMVGHVPMDHTYSFMCTNHIDMTVHNQPFYELGSTL